MKKSRPILPTRVYMRTTLEALKKIAEKQKAKIQTNRSNPFSPTTVTFLCAPALREKVLAEWREGMRLKIKL